MSSTFGASFADPADEDSEAFQCLTAVGVSKRNAARFLTRARCISAREVALFLRLQLPPLGFANTHAVDTETEQLLGIRGSKARKLLQDLGVLDALPPQVEDEAIRHGGELDTMPNPPGYGLSKVLGTPPASADEHALNPADPAVLSAGLPEGSPLHNITPGKSGPTVPASRERESFSSRLLGTPRGTSHAYAGVSGILHSEGPVAMSGRVGMTHLLAHNEIGDSVSKPFGAAASRGLAAQNAVIMTTITASKPADPGPYHRANATLRSVLPHYDADVTVRTDWGLVAIVSIGFLTLLLYTAVRIWYLVDGRTAEFAEGGRVKIWYSILALAAETALGTVGICNRMLTWRQRTKFTQVSSADAKRLHRAADDGDAAIVQQTVHVLVATYTEDVDLVRECVLRLLVAPEPVYMQKVIYVCDDGHARETGPAKRAMVRHLNALGHHNVLYIGDRVKHGQLNGKSANLNHCILTKVYPRLSTVSEIPDDDIIMIMDCDHMVKPELFMKMGACMLDPKVGVTLVPQSFHNVITPDCFDSANANFMFNQLPYVFGSGCCFITGTNVMVRAKGMFLASRFYDAENDSLKPSPLGTPQLLCEQEISEDIELGSRMHARGWKSVFIKQNLATGEVPLAPRAMWRQRLRWFKGGHLFVLNKHSIFFRRQRYLTPPQRLAYCIGLIAHIAQIWATPVIFTMPLMCIVFEVCAFGIDRWLFYTHLARVAGSTLLSAHATSRRYSRAGLTAMTGARVQWFTGVKAVLNTLMVLSGWKRPPAFKLTPKMLANGEMGDMPEMSVPLEVAPTVGESPPSKGGAKRESDGSSGTVSAKSRAPRLDLTKPASGERVQAHRTLSKVTETRRWCMPMGGTFDVWVLATILFINLVAMAVGLRFLAKRNVLLEWGELQESVVWIGVIWAAVEVCPSALFLGYIFVWDCSPWLLKIWVPLVVTLCTAFVVFAEVRIFVGFTFGI